MKDQWKKPEAEHNLDGEVDNLKSRDEILQVMYWMTGEGLGEQFSVSDLRKFLPSEQNAVARDLELMVRSGLLELHGDKFALTDQGKAEGARRFADEFESMTKPGHFECDAPDCDCHSPESAGEACKHLATAYAN